MTNAHSITIAISFIDTYVSVTIQLPSSVQYGTSERRAILNRKMRRRGQGIIKSDRGLISGRGCGVKHDNGEAWSGSKLRVPGDLISERWERVLTSKEKKGKYKGGTQ